MSLRHLSRFTLLAAAVSALPLARAGFMDVDIGVQLYRDLAENRGVFAAGATNVPIYNLAGDLIGTLSAPLPNFDSVSDIGQSTLTGGQFMLSAGHDGNTYPVSFTRRFGAAEGSVFADTYSNVSKVSENKGTSSGNPAPNLDLRVTRLNKVVTDAVSTHYLTDASIAGNLQNYTVMRIGAGGQHTIDYGPTKRASDSSTWVVPDADPEEDGYTFLTAGTVKVGEVRTFAPTNDPLSLASEYTTYMPRTYTNSDNTVLPLPVYSGDSGSPLLVYNPGTLRWEVAGVTSLAADRTAMNGGAFTENSSWGHSPGFIASIIDKYAAPEMHPVSGSTIHWLAPSADADGDGVVDGAITDGASSWAYKALSSAHHGDTSTTTTGGATFAYVTPFDRKTNNDRLDEMLDLTFGSAGGNIIVDAAVDTGAGSVTFKGDYTISGARLITAGYIISAGKTVTSTLTAIAGDEWRVIGDGKFVIAGTGANAADLNVGGNTLTELNRTGGVAVRNVKINGGAATVRLVGDNQISGDVIFGHRGGTLDLYGHDFARAVVYALDDGATFANLKANTTATLTFTGSGTQDYLGNFIDGGSPSTGLLNVHYNPGTPAGARWNLSGIVANKGAFTVSAGEVRVAGVPTLHAGGYIDPNDWQTAVFATGTLTVASGAKFTVGDHAVVTLGPGAKLVIADNATLRLGAFVAGAMDAGGVAVITLSGGVYDFKNSGKLDLGGVLDGISAGTHSYTLITGAAAFGNTELKLSNITGYDAGLIALTSFSGGVLTFTAIPEPATYGLVGAGALAAAALVRRRRRRLAGIS